MNTDAAMSPRDRRPRGFALPGYAAAAAKKGHDLGPPHCYRFTADDRKRAAEERQKKRREAKPEPPPQES